MKMIQKKYYNKKNIIIKILIYKYEQSYKVLYS